MSARRKAPKQGHTDRAHAPLPPSASARWLACPPSQGYIARLIDRGIIKKRVSGEPAQRGTRIHELGEQFIKWLLAGKKIDSFKAGDAAEIATAKDYARFCMAKVASLQQLYGDTIHGVEDTGVLTPGVCWGSRDFWVLAGGRHLAIVDLKTGRHPVPVKGNSQELIYAADLVLKHNPKTIELCIWQPAADDGAEPERSHTYTRAEYDALLMDIRAGTAKAAWWLDRKTGHEAGLIAGDHCTYCDALGVCPRARDRSLAISSDKFQPVPIDRTELPSVAVLEADQVAEILRRAPLFNDWLEAVRIHALELMHKGREVPGFKVVQKLTRRAWDQKYSDAQIARGVGLAATDMTRSVRLSPAQVEEKLDKDKRAKLQRFVFKPEGEPVVVPITDRRVPLLATKINFTPVSNEEEDDG